MAVGSSSSFFSYSVLVKAVTIFLCVKEIGRASFKQFNFYYFILTMALMPRPKSKVQARRVHNTVTLCRKEVFFL